MEGLLYYFNPRSPCGERPERSEVNCKAIAHFNPRSPCGERHERPKSLKGCNKFQSTLPVRGATPELFESPDTQKISIHAPRAGSDNLQGVFLLFWIVISIHAPRAGSDLSRCPCRWSKCISIHAPRAGSDGGTRRNGYAKPHFNPRSPCGERRFPKKIRIISTVISIHAPRAGSDPVIVYLYG